MNRILKQYWNYRSWDMPLSASHTLTASFSERVVGQCLVLLSVACTSVAWGPMAEAEIMKHPCSDVAAYYQGTTGLEGERLRKKLFSITRNHYVLPYHQTWDALKLLDAADPIRPRDSSFVFEIYSQKPVLKNLAGKRHGWTREHLWPYSYGLRRGHPEYNDLHNLRPADAKVNSARGKKYFGECNPINEKTCLSPAFKGAAVDTATNKKIWMPPLKVRGDIARSLMYMAVRYASDRRGEDFYLQLSDTPNEERARMGELSVLLKWNREDPPSREEKLRNWRVCSVFQHNRNPFVDHPEFALRIWHPALLGEDR